MHSAEDKNAFLQINPPTTAKRSVIWLHGLGADGSDFIPIVPELRLPESLGIRFIFPHAPIMPVTLNHGYEMRAWYDIYGLDRNAKIDTPGIAASVRRVEHLIEQEIKQGIPSDQIIVAGFSQGAVIALSTGLTFTQPLGGIIALSGYLPNAKFIIETASPANQTIPIFLAHGTEDTVVPYALGKAAYLTLEEAHYAVDWHSYVMGHSVCPQEINDISLWIKKILSNHSNPVNN